MTKIFSKINIEESLEFLQIKSYRKIINDIVFKSGTLTGSLDKIITVFIERLFNQDYFIRCQNDKKRLPNKIIKIKTSIFTRLFREGLSDSIVKELIHNVTQNPYKLLALSNYAFIEHIFWLDCNNSIELKNFRATETANQEIMESQKHRHRAEEFYKKGHVDEAYREFKIAEALDMEDFTISFQLALIHFFEYHDHVSAIEYFEKAAVLSKMYSNQVFIYSKILKSLILRITAFLKHDIKMLNEAYECALEGYKQDTNYNFSKYAIIQCQIDLSLTPESIKDALGAIQKLIKEDKIYAIQGIYDHVFDGVIETLEKNLTDVLNDLEIDCEYNLLEIKKLFDALNNQNKFMSDPSKIFTAHKEWQNLKNRLTNKTYFDFKYVEQKSLNLMSTLNDIQIDVTKNKHINDIKEFIEKIIPEYNLDFKTAMAPYESLHTRNNNLILEKNKILELFPKIKKMKYINQNNEEILENNETQDSSRIENHESRNESLYEAENEQKKKDAAGIAAERALIAKSEKLLSDLKQTIKNTIWIGLLVGATAYFYFFQVTSYLLFIFIIAVNISLISIYCDIAMKIFSYIKKERFESIKKELNNISFKLNIHKHDIAKIEENTHNKYAAIVKNQFNDLDDTAARQCLLLVLSKSFDKLRSIVYPEKHL